MASPAVVITITPDSQEHSLYDSKDLPYHITGEIVPQFTLRTLNPSQTAARIWLPAPSQTHKSWRLGINLKDACAGRLSSLLSPDPDELSPQFSWLFMQWPRHQKWFGKLTAEGRAISRSATPFQRVVQLAALNVKEFLQSPTEVSQLVGPDPKWDLQGGKFELEHMYLVELRQLDEGGCQPVLAYDWWAAHCAETELRQKSLDELSRSIARFLHG